MTDKKGTENTDGKYVRNSNALDKRKSEVKILDNKRGAKGVEILDRNPKSAP